jgi:NADH dehydrogenase/NADH:ubiquinone oxidoreductase subunit G
LQIDGKEVTAKEGMTVLKAAQSAGISIPTLCHHEKLEPFGGCRICIVEAEVSGEERLVVSCVYPVEEKCGGICGVWSQAGDQVHPGNCPEGVP